VVLGFRVLGVPGSGGATGFRESQEVLGVPGVPDAFSRDESQEVPGLRGFQLLSYRMGARS